MQVNLRQCYTSAAFAGCLLLLGCGGPNRVAGLPGTRVSTPTADKVRHAPQELATNAGSGNEEPATDAAPAATPATSKPEQPLAERYADVEPLQTQKGRASYYADKFIGRKTASGERYDARRFTAAHRSLPFGTIVRIIRLDENKTTYVRITDRGPFGSRSRIVDVSRAAARELEMLRAGVIPVRIEVIELGAE